MCFLFEHTGDFVVAYSQAEQISTRRDKQIKSVNQDEIDNNRLSKVVAMLNQNKSIRSVMKEAGVSAATVRNIANMHGITLDACHRKVGTQTFKNISAQLRKGDSVADIAKEFSVSVNDVEQVLTGQLEIKRLRREYRRATRQKLARAAVDKCCKTIVDCRVKDLKKYCYSDYMWLYKNDREWLSQKFSGNTRMEG
jgi:transposase